MATPEGVDPLPSDAPESGASVDPVRPLHEADAADREAVTLRAATALSRTRDASQRDDAARRRDLNALARDRAAAARDRAAERREAAVRSDQADRRVRAYMAGLREQASQDRARAAADRERAAADREQAAADRRQARIDLARAHLDHLTGVYTRALGEETLRHEIDRAQRLNEPFTLAFVDVDGLKALNDCQGHGAGDAFLRSLAEAMQAHLRSYDPIVRMGGDEFICGFVGADRDSAEPRIAQIRSTLAEQGAGATISVGIVELKVGENLQELISRGDDALYRDKYGRRG